MKTLIFRTAAENSYASASRLTAVFEIELDKDTYDALNEKAPKKSRCLQEIDLYDLEEISFNGEKWCLGNELKDRAERALVDKYEDMFRRKEISWITDVYEVYLYWPRELTK